MFKEVVIVEGYHDLERLVRIYKDIDVIITNGSEIKESLPVIKAISKKRDIILFLDPDYPGERIRKIINAEIPQAKHAFIKREKAFSANRKKIGVEHASDEEIINALSHVLSPYEYVGEITNKELINLGYVGEKNSSFLRELLAKELNIGHTNAKTLLKRLNLFGITVVELRAYTQKIKENFNESK